MTTPHFLSVFLSEINGLFSETAESYLIKGKEPNHKKDIDYQYIALFVSDGYAGIICLQKQ